MATANLPDSFRLVHTPVTLESFWQCVDCLNISISLRWFCDSCEQAVMDPRGTVPPPQNDKLENLISLVEKLMQRYETFENKLHDKCDVADAAKIETKISKLEEKFSKWDHEVEARLQSLEQKAQSATVNCTTEMMNGPSDEELIK